MSENGNGKGYKFSEVNTFRAKEFKNEVVKLDCRSFRECVFDNVTFVFDGGPIDFSHNKIVNGFALRPEKDETKRLIVLLNVMTGERLGKMVRLIL